MKPNLILYSHSASINIFEKESQWQRLMKFWQKVQGQRLKPNTISYNANMSACEKESS